MVTFLSDSHAGRIRGLRTSTARAATPPSPKAAADSLVHQHEHPQRRPLAAGDPLLVRLPWYGFPRTPRSFCQFTKGKGDQGSWRTSTESEDGMSSSADTRQEKTDAGACWQHSSVRLMTQSSAHTRGAAAAVGLQPKGEQPRGRARILKIRWPLLALQLLVGDAMICVVAPERRRVVKRRWRLAASPAGRGGARVMAMACKRCIRRGAEDAPAWAGRRQVPRVERASRVATVVHFSVCLWTAASQVDR
eukprot:COSAG04_NODE_1001_length_8839_cov_3.422883_11_plen_249_part_00